MIKISFAFLFSPCVPNGIQAMCRAREITTSLVLRRDEKKTLREIKEKQGRVACKKGVEGEA